MFGKVNIGKGIALVWSLISSTGRAQLTSEASLSRSDREGVRLGLILVIAYNIVGIADIISTNLSIGAGLGEEANPLMAYAMTQLGPGWIGAKLFLQGVITFMVLWFPHKIVLGVFFVSTISNILIVANNFAIYFFG